MGWERYCQLIKTINVIHLDILRIYVRESACKHGREVELKFARKLIFTLGVFGVDVCQARSGQRLIHPLARRAAGASE